MAAFPPPQATHPAGHAKNGKPGPKNGPHHSTHGNGPVGRHPGKHKKHHPAPTAYVFPVRTGDLLVSPGQLTFEAEGDDVPSSPYFSRKITWPGRVSDGPGKGSGVTIGRGYDMGGRSEQNVTADLTAAGMDATTAAAFAKGASASPGPGSDDKSSQGFVANHREELGTITTAVQKKLFENIYPNYVARATASYNYHATSKAVAWASLKPAIRDVLVDFVYQGYGKMKAGYGRPMQAGMNNDFQELINYINGSKALTHDEAARHRVAYLVTAQAEEKAALPQSIPTVPTK